MLEKNKDDNEFVFSTRYKKPGGSDDDTIITFLEIIYSLFYAKSCLG